MRSFSWYYIIFFKAFRVFSVFRGLKISGVNHLIPWNTWNLHLILFKQDDHAFQEEEG